MPFPKSPKKAVKGNLKLLIKPAHTETIISSEEPEDLGKDFSENLQINLPRGFQMEQDVETLLLKQQKTAVATLERIKSKINSCKQCGGRGLGSVSMAEKSLNFVVNYLVKNSSTLVNIVIHQDPTGEITFRLSAASNKNKRRLHILFDYTRIELGFYVQEYLKFTESYEVNRYYQDWKDGPIGGALDWLVGKDEI